MPADFSALNAQIAALTEQVDKTIGVEASAAALLSGVSAMVAKAISDALAADNAVDDAAATAANAAVQAALDKLKASSDPLAAAVAANNNNSTPANPTADPNVP